MAHQTQAYQCQTQMIVAMCLMHLIRQNKSLDHATPELQRSSERIYHDVDKVKADSTRLIDGNNTDIINDDHTPSITSHHVNTFIYPL